MILAAHQPAYLPWLGYFDKIARADVFVYMDNVQFEKNSFINRNRIKTPQGAQWLTIPVKTRGHLAGSLRDTEIDETRAWRAKHLQSISMNYRRAAHFERYFPELERLISEPQPLLAEFCWGHLRFWVQKFGIETRLARASELPVSGTKSALVLAYCQFFGATRYVSGVLGRDYLVESDFERAGITVEYQDYNPPAYPQLWGEFIPRLSIVDAWLNCGTAVEQLLRSS